jgi:hypothetical protein
VTSCFCRGHYVRKRRQSSTSSYQQRCSHQVHCQWSAGTRCFVEIQGTANFLRYSYCILLRQENISYTSFWLIEVNSSLSHRTIKNYIVLYHATLRFDLIFLKTFTGAHQMNSIRLLHEQSLRFIADFSNKRINCAERLPHGQQMYALIGSERNRSAI